MDQEKEFPVKTRRVTVTNKKTGTRYIEERQYRYDPKKGYNVLISSRRTGKKILKGETTPVRCRPKKASAPNTSNAIEAKRTRIGALELLSYAGRISGLDAAVRASYVAGGTTEKLLSVAQYLVATGETVHNIEAWQCEHDLPYEEGLSEDVCYNLFDELGLHETGMQTLFRELAYLGGEKQQAIAFDSTSHSVYGEGVKPYARQGFNKDGDGLEIYKVASFFSLSSGLPISFELQPGNIPDVTSLMNAIKRAKSYGLKNPELCLDNGFFSKENVLRFLRRSMKFTVLATQKNSWIYKYLDQETDGVKLRDEFSKYAAQCPFDRNTSAVSASDMVPFTWKRQRTAKGVPAGSTESQSFRLYFHFYRNACRAVFEASAFSEKLSRYEAAIAAGNEMTETELEFAQKYFSWKHVRGGKINITPNEEAIAEAQKDFGVFVLVSNKHADPWDALKLYRQRNDIEASYRVVKSEMDGRKPRVWTMKNIRGKELCRHVALGYKFALLRLLEKTQREAKRRATAAEEYNAEERKLYGKVAAWAGSLTIKQMLDWFDCIELVTVKNQRAQHRWSTETTKRDQAFLDLFLSQTV